MPWFTFVIQLSRISKSGQNRILTVWGISQQMCFNFCKCQLVLRYDVQQIRFGNAQKCYISFSKTSQLLWFGKLSRIYKQLNFIHFYFWMSMPFDPRESVHKTVSNDRWSIEGFCTEFPIFNFLVLPFNVLWLLKIQCCVCELKLGATSTTIMSVVLLEPLMSLFYP